VLLTGLRKGKTKWRELDSSEKKEKVVVAVEL
jgi:hypothetical protein